MDLKYGDKSQFEPTEPYYDGWAAKQLLRMNPDSVFIARSIVDITIELAMRKHYELLNELEAIETR